MSKKTKSGSKKSVKPIVCKNATQLAKSLKLKTSEVRPSGKYPALFYQEGVNEFGHCGDRLRIIYPSGRAEYRGNPFNFWAVPCWSSGLKREFFDQIRSMHSYDYARAFGPAIYLGELK